MQQTSTKDVQDKLRLGGLGDPLGIVQNIEIGDTTRIHPRKLNSATLRYKNNTESHPEEQAKF